MNKLIKYLAFLFLSSVVFFTACTQSEDIMTSNVVVGGLVTPITVNVPYKLNATPSFDINIRVPKGPAIDKVELYKVFKNKAGKSSNSALLTTLNVNKGNVADDFTGKVTLNYTSLTSGLTINGTALPANESLLNIGEYWTINYVAVMSDDQRKVINASTTNIGVANKYAGTYQCVGVFTHPVAGPRPINEEKFLKPLTANSCNIPVGDLGSSGYFVDIVIDQATNTVTFANGVPVDILPSDKRSYYEPATGKFYLYYYYVGGTGNRVIEEVYTPKN